MEKCRGKMPQHQPWLEHYREAEWHREAVTLVCPSSEGFLEGEEGWIQGLIDWQVSVRAGGGPTRGEAEEHQLWLECWFYHVQPHIQPCLSFHICKMGVTIPVLSGVGGLWVCVIGGENKHGYELGAAKQTQESGAGVPQRRSRTPTWCSLSMQLADRLLKCCHL